MLTTSCVWYLPLQHPSLCSYIIRKQASELPNCQNQLLGYWRQPMPVFDKILTLLFLITDSWLGVLISWSVNLLWFPSPPSGIKATFLFPPDSVSVIFIQLRWAEKAKILASNASTHVSPLIFSVTPWISHYRLHFTDQNIRLRNISLTAKILWLARLRVRVETQGFWGCSYVVWT